MFEQQSGKIQPPLANTGQQGRNALLSSSVDRLAASGNILYQAKPTLGLCLIAADNGFKERITWHTGRKRRPEKTIERYLVGAGAVVREDGFRDLIF